MLDGSMYAVTQTLRFCVCLCGCVDCLRMCQSIKSSHWSAALISTALHRSHTLVRSLPVYRACHAAHDGYICVKLNVWIMKIIKWNERTTQTNWISNTSEWWNACQFSPIISILHVVCVCLCLCIFWFSPIWRKHRKNKCWLTASNIGRPASWHNDNSLHENNFQPFNGIRAA